MEEKTNNNEVLEKIHLLLAIFVLLWLNAGTYSYISDYIPTYIKITMYGLWLGLAIITKKKYVDDLVKLTLPLLFFMIIVKTSSIFASNTNLEAYLTNFIYAWIIASISIYYIKDKKENIKIILVVLIIDIIYVGINTFVNLIANPLISRLLSAGSDVKYKLIGDMGAFKAIGSYAYCYSLVMLFLVILDFTIKCKKNKILHIIELALISLLLLKAQFTIAILLTIIFCAKIVIDNMEKKKIVKYLLLLMIYVGIILLPVIIKSITQLDMLPSEIKIRLIEINNAIQGTEDVDNTDLHSRMALYEKSIKTFGSNIIIGSWGENNIGGHSTFFDYFGLYGTFAIFLILFYSNMYRYVKNNIGTKGQIILKNIWLYYLTLSIINTVIFTTLTVMLFVVVPFFIKFAYERIEDNENSLDS